MLKGTYANFYQPLSINDIKAIHEASMQVLSKSGLLIDNKRALQLFHEKGARVDFTHKLVQLDEDWVMKYLNKAPARITLYGRDENNNLVVEPNRVYFGTGGTALNILDRKSGKRRPSVSSDIADIARLVDALPNIHWYCLPLYPNECPKEEVDIARFYHGLKNTGKHVMGGIYGGKEGARDVIRLAQIFAGGEENLRNNPLISVICSTISPLKMDTRYVDFIFDLVNAGIPIATSCAPIAGATAPVTLAGSLVQINAEAICGILLTQVIKESAPALYSTVPTTANMKNMDFLFGAVENGIMNAACAQLASFYNLPMYSTGGVTESKIFDIQNGYEKCMNNLLPAIAGAQLIHNAAGQIDSSMTVAYEQYVLDDEIIGMALRVMEGIRITSDTLALEEICKVGPGGNYLASDHTVRNMRHELFMPKVAVRTNYAAWLREGKRNAIDFAREITDQILEDHYAQSLPENTESEIFMNYPFLKEGE
ncbi:MAG: trimethylamine methyltransferase family protein [Bacillota bacterium]|nr:trimethylamine methyltransferase family protein [Bacillota bacterium]